MTVTVTDRGCTNATETALTTNSTADQPAPGSANHTSSAAPTSTSDSTSERRQNGSDRGAGVAPRATRSESATNAARNRP
jgi:hypothetical protein